MFHWILLSLGLFAAPYAHGSSWGYEKENGPDTWAQNFKDYCAGNRQSPIDIQVSKATENSNLGPLVFTGYSQKLDGEIVNNGHSVQVTLTGSGKKPSVTSKGLKDVYEFQQMHLHWGDVRGRGSEHTIDGKPSSAEIHLVHYNTKYDTSEAAKHSDGILVLGVMLKDSVGAENTAYDPITRALLKVQRPDQKTALAGPITLGDLLPRNTHFYATYPGSLTTPTCNEAVTWVVFPENVVLGDIQVEQFRLVQTLSHITGEAIPLVNNYRPPQPLNSRTVHVHGLNEV